MRITYSSVFAVTLLATWTWFAIWGDANLYVVYPERKVIKDVATLSDRLVWALLPAFSIAVLNTMALALCLRLRTLFASHEKR